MSNKPLTFKEWKKTFTGDCWFRATDDYHKATSVVFNAYISHRDGELTARGLEAALNWGFDLNFASALHEVTRARTRNYYKKVVDTTESVT